MAKEVVKTFSVVEQTYHAAYPVAKLKPHPDNVNEGDLGAIYQSIEENGFYGAVLFQSTTGFILAGKHRWAAAIEAGAKTVPAIEIECSDDDALAIMLSDNRTNRLGRDNTQKLAEVLAGLQQRRGLQGTGFDREDLDRVIGDLDRPLKFDLFESRGTGTAENDGMQSGAARPQNTVALSIFFTVKESKRWDAWREECGERDDTKALLLLLEEVNQ